MLGPLGSTTTGQTSQDVLSSRKLFSRDVGYLRDLALFWPFVIYTIFAVACLFSPPDRRFGLRLAAVALAALLLARERLLLFVVGLGFIAIQCAINLVSASVELGVIRRSDSDSVSLSSGESVLAETKTVLPIA